MVLVCKLSQTIDKPINYVSCALRASITVGEESARSQVAVRETKREKIPASRGAPTDSRRMRAARALICCASTAPHWPLAIAAAAAVNAGHAGVHFARSRRIYKTCSNTPR